MEKITPDFLAAYSIDDMTADELQSERRQYLLASIAEDEAQDEITPLDITELAWLERNPARLVDSAQTKKTQRRQFMLAHMALRGDEPVKGKQLRWLEDRRLVRKRPVRSTNKRCVGEYELVPDYVPDALAPTFSETNYAPSAFGNSMIAGWDEESEGPAGDWGLLPYPLYKHSCNPAEISEHHNQELFAKAQQAESPEQQKAVWEIVLRNKGLVLAFTPKFKRLRTFLAQSEDPAIDRRDFIQEALFVLKRAAEKYQPEKGMFSTYVVGWIHSSAGRVASSHRSGIRLPVHASEELLRIQRTNQMLTSFLQREPTIEETAAELGTGKRKLETFMRKTQPVASLDGMLADQQTARIELADDYASEDPLTVDDMLLDEGAEFMTYIDYGAAEADSMREYITELFSALDVREQEIIRLRFSIQTNRPRMTLEEIGNEFGITRERIRQIEVKALLKMRNLQQQGRSMSGPSLLPAKIETNTSTPPMSQEEQQIFLKTRLDKALEAYPEADRSELADWLTRTKRSFGLMYGRSKPTEMLAIIQKSGWIKVTDLPGSKQVLTKENLDKALLEVREELDVICSSYTARENDYVIAPSSSHWHGRPLENDEPRLAIWQIKPLFDD